MKNVRQFDVGVEIDFPITEDGAAVDLTGASATVIFQPPGVDSFVRSGSIPTPASGVVRYVTQPGDLGWWGLWKAQAHVVLASGVPDVRTTTRTFEVEPNLEPPEIFIRPDPCVSVGLAPALTLS